MATLNKIYKVWKCKLRRCKNELALHIYKSMDISTPPRTILCRKLVKGDWLFEQRAGGWEGTWHSKTRGRSIPEIEEIASIMAQGLKVSLPCSHFRMKPLWYTLWGRQGGLLTYGLMMGVSRRVTRIKTYLSCSVRVDNVGMGEDGQAS